MNNISCSFSCDTVYFKLKVLFAYKSIWIEIHFGTKEKTSHKLGYILPDPDYLVHLLDIFLGFERKLCIINHMTSIRYSKPGIASFYIFM